MSVYRKAGGWVYDFVRKHKRYTSESFDHKDDAAEAESTHKRRLQRRDAGLEPIEPDETPLFTDWAGETLAWQIEKKQLKAPDAARNTLRMVLAFWGERPRRKKPVAGGEYRNLRLGDAVTRPELVEEFEQWMIARGISGARRNHYRSACSMMFKVAMQPANKGRTGIRENPFAGIFRDRVRRRTATLTMEQLQAWLTSAPMPVAVAATIGAMLPALRFGTIVDLRWSQIDTGMQFVTIPVHKADQATNAPVVVAISPPLRKALKQLRTLHAKADYVVPLPNDKRDRYWLLQKLVKQSIIAADLPYGRKRDDGVTFHTLRHSVSTLLARWGVSPTVRQRAMAHQTPQMAEWYTHLGGADTTRPMALIGRRLRAADVLLTRLEAQDDRESPARSTLPHPNERD